MNELLFVKIDHLRGLAEMREYRRRDRRGFAITVLLSGAMWWLVIRGAIWLFS